MNSIPRRLAALALTSAPALIPVLTPVPGRAENYAPGNVGTFVASGSGGFGLVPLTGCFNGVITTDAVGNAQCTPLSQFVRQAPSGVGVTPTPPPNAAPGAPTGLTASVTPNTITIGWSPVNATPAVTSYVIFKDGSNTPLATLAANTTSYTDTGIESGTNHSYAVFAANPKGNSPYQGSVGTTTTFTGAYAQQYPRLLGASGGAATATTVAAKPAGFQLASYGDGFGFNNFSNLATSTFSVHGGHANPSDWAGGVGFWLGGGKVQGDFGVTGYPGQKMLSLPLVYHGPTGAPGELLANAARGNYDAQYDAFGASIMAAVDVNQPVNGQVNIYIRMGEEFNAPSNASNDWAPQAGHEADFVGAFDRAVTRLRGAEAAYTPLPGHTKPHMIYVWCYNLTGSDPRNSYPGDGYVDVVGNDIYVFPQFGDSLDPDTQFARLKSTQWGLDFTVAFARAHNKPISVPEAGSALDNYGQYYKLFYNWATQNNVAYICYWNNNGDIEGQFSDGTYPETGAMLRHLINPASFPVEPIPAPQGLATSTADGSIMVSAVAVPASIGATTYYLFEGPAAGQEDLGTPVASGSTPSFTIPSANGVQKFLRMSAGNALSIGFLSTEVTVAATPAAANTPAHYLALGSSGYASTPVMPAMVPGAQDWSIAITHCVTNLADANKPGGASSALAGIWSSTSGYLQSLTMSLGGGNIAAAAHDNGGNTGGYYGSATYVQNGCYVDEFDYSSAGQTGKIYHDPLGAGTHTLVGSIGSFGSKTTQAGTPATDPSSHIAPAFRIGQDADGTEQYSGLFVSLIYKIGTTVILNPVVNADGTIHDVTGATWPTGGSAAFH